MFCLCIFIAFFVFILYFFLHLWLYHRPLNDKQTKIIIDLFRSDCSFDIDFDMNFNFVPLNKTKQKKTRLLAPSQHPHTINLFIMCIFETISYVILILQLLQHHFLWTNQKKNHIKNRCTFYTTKFNRKWWFTPKNR